MFAEHLHGKFLHHFAVSQDGLDDARAHHASVVGNAVVEVERVDRRDLRFISNAHPGQCGGRPIGAFAWAADARFHISRNGDFEVFGRADAVQAVDKLTRVVVVGAVDEHTDAHVGGFADDVFSRQDAVAS